MRKGIACGNCNTIKGSLKEYSCATGEYQCKSCGAKGDILSDQDNKLWLVPNTSDFNKDSNSKLPVKNLRLLNNNKTLNNEWRSFIPKVVKEKVPEWTIVSIIDIYSVTNKMLAVSKGKNWMELRNFINKLNIIFEEFSEDYTPKKEVEDNEKEKNENPTLLKKKIFSKEQDRLTEELIYEEWRNFVPLVLKKHIPQWKTISRELMYQRAKEIMATSREKEWLEIANLVDKLDEIVDQEKDEEDIVNPLEVISKYQYRKENIGQKIQKLRDESWREKIPNVIKKYISNWQSELMEDVYNKSKLLMSDETGDNLTKIRNFVADLSQYVFENDMYEEAEEEQQKSEFTDESAEYIMSLIEIIILPHLEVLDKVQQKGGKILFSDLWNKPFNESLKKDVKDRDGWKCVVCETEVDLHVHHKIPRNLGGIHHKDNLVTLCASCHGAVETADIQRAFNKCWANYKKNKISKNIYEEVSRDKQLLKEEVETMLDKLLVELNNKEEFKLMSDVGGIIKRLEVIFYE